MAVEIIHVMTLSGALTISDEGVEWVERDGVVPEGYPTYQRRGRVNHVEMDWTGEGSRDAMVEGPLAEFFSYTKGTAEFVFIAENGEMFGLHVCDGRMMWRKAQVSLGDVCEPPVDRWGRGGG